METKRTQDSSYQNKNILRAYITLQCTCGYLIFGLTIQFSKSLEFSKENPKFHQSYENCESCSNSNEEIVSNLWRVFMIAKHFVLSCVDVEKLLLLLCYLKDFFWYRYIDLLFWQKTNLQEDLINNVVLDLLEDDDIRVRSAAAKCFARYGRDVKIDKSEDSVRSYVCCF